MKTLLLLTFPVALFVATAVQAAEECRVSVTELATTRSCLHIVLPSQVPPKRVHTVSVDSARVANMPELPQPQFDPVVREVIESDK